MLDGLDHLRRSKEVDPNWKSIPYGEPMANQRAYVLDAKLQPLPIGVSGELYLGGIGVGRGYFERPELTAERFLDNPFVDDSEPACIAPAIWRAGCRTATLELLGRIDNQVKIRGFRIELGEIESRLRSHPGVREGVVVTKRRRHRREGAWSRTSCRIPSGRATRTRPATSEPEQVEQWQAVYDHAYTANAAADVEDPTFNIVSWDSSYTNKALPTEQMRSWVDQTVDRIQKHAPKEVLEIGCGMGLLLFRIAPNCSRYLGHDFSKVALDYVAKHREPLGLPQVELARRWADDFSGLADNSLDCVVLNSIILDFPSMDYLMEVVRGSAKAVRPGGTIFLGDVRGLPLMQAYQSSVQLFQAPDDLATDQVRARIGRFIRHEEELVIDPRFFPWLATQIEGLGRVQIQLKRGSFTNELNSYRYDVTVHVGDVAQVPEADAELLDWDADRLDLAALRARLEASATGLVVVRNIPNARVERDLRTVELLADSACPATAGELRAQLGEIAAGAQNPEDFWALGDDLGFDADVRFSADLASGRFDAAFFRTTTEAGEPAVLFPDETGLEVDPALRARDFANNPMMGKLSRQLGPSIRELLSAQLPEYMVPALTMTLDALPLSPNGKVDRKQLPEPDTSRPDMDSEFRAPRTLVESVVADIWTDVLTFDRVGVDDSFFDLGGHSLLAVLIQTRLNQLFPVGVTLAEIFEFPSVAKLSQRIVEKGETSGIDVEEVCRILQSIDELSDEEVASQIGTNE